MADSAMLTKLKTRLGITGTAEDAVLNDLIEESMAAACAVAEATEIPASHEFIVVRMAANEYQQLGLEGEKSHSEGGESHTIDLLPEKLLDMLKALRTAKVVEM
jgi:hypothetical protein